MKKRSFITLFTIGVLVASLSIINSCKKDEEEPVDPCASVVCQNGGSCSGGSCNCATGYEGTNCETEWSAKFVGTYSYTVQAGCNNSPSGDSATVERLSATSIKITNWVFGGSGSSFFTANTSSSTNLTIPNQTVGNVPYAKITGTGVKTSTGFNITVTVTDTTTSTKLYDGCTFVYVKE